MLVTSGHDRVFGEMVKAQQAEERKKKEKDYRERKLQERKKAEEEHRRKKKEAAEREKRGEKPKVQEDEEVKEKKDGEAKDGKKGEGEEMVVPPTPATIDSNIKVKDGEEVLPPKDIEAVVVKGDKVVVAVPVKNDKGANEDPAAKHEVEAIAAAPGEATKPEVAAAAEANAVKEAEAKDPNPEVNGNKAKDDKAKDDKVKDDKVKDNKAKDVKDAKDAKAKKPFDPVREAELLAKMVANGQTPPGVGMEDIKLAFKALEAASEPHGKDKKDTPVIWMWHDRCETWRWKNYEIGVQDVGPGGWEERDWKVFADDRGCAEFDLEESWAEEDEEDIHDWSV